MNLLWFVLENVDDFLMESAFPFFFIFFIRLEQCCVWKRLCLKRAKGREFAPRFVFYSGTIYWLTLALFCKQRRAHVAITSVGTVSGE